ncbi:C-C motif chemokine 27 [Pelobates fuscus]|uniref:C-C motif chemokine 27 n=1 Tax=Pelobates fuscus TaxID=191477 RepID=UPI002FE47354
MRSVKHLVTAALILFLFLQSSDGLRDNFMSCCTQLAKRIPKNMLPQVTKVHFQKKDGICNLQAIVLHVRNQKKCMDPNIKSLRKWIKNHLAASGVRV